MTTSSPETSTHATGAHRAPRRTPRSPGGRPPVRYEPYLDGLFTYCLSVLCDHDAATDALGDVLALSERQYGRSPADPGGRKAWLYALARWACLRKLTAQRRKRHGAHAGRSVQDPVPPAPAPASVPVPRPTDATAATAEGPTPESQERRRRELAQLAWPEAAGTTPEQREILELAVRHQLGPHEVAAVLSMEPAAARELLASAACEVERTRAALAVVETGDCPSVARLTGDNQVLLSAGLRRELVRHVDDCPCCRRVAERAGAAGPWPGSRPGSGPGFASASRTRPAAASPAVLPLVEAPRAAAYTAMIRAPRGRTSAPRFGRNGFPMDPKDRAARRDRLRARAVTTTVVATVVAAPVLALWAAYRGAPETGEGHDGPSVSASEGDGTPGLEGTPYERYENAGNAQNRTGYAFDPGGDRTPDVSVEVISDGTSLPPPAPGVTVPGRLTVEARSTGATTMITLKASGAPVSWSARTGASWLRLSSNSGRLAPGDSITIRVLVDYRRQPSGYWTARIELHPSGSVVKIDGFGRRQPSADPTRPGHPEHPGQPGHPGHPGPGRPTGPGPTDPDPSGPGPSDPGGPTPSDPPPSDPPPSDPPPSDPPPSNAPTGDPPAPADPPPDTPAAPPTAS